MYSKNNRPTTEHKKWWSVVAQCPCIVCMQYLQEETHPVEIHHVKGASYKHNKEWVGQWYVLPLCPHHHRLGDLNVTTNKRGFESAFTTEKELFQDLIFYVWNSNLHDLKFITEYNFFSEYIYEP